MTILAQNGSTMVNYDNVLAITMNDKYIHAHPANGGQPIAIGVYDSRERTKEVFTKMSTTIMYSDGIPKRVIMDKE